MSTTTIAKPRVISHAQIRRWRACARDAQTARRLYPDGVPLTREAAQRLEEAGCDVLWGLLRLLEPDDLRAFIAFTLRQQQPAIAALLRQAGLRRHAAAVEGLALDDMARAEGVFAAAARAAGWRRPTRIAGITAWDAAWAAAQPATVRAAEAAAVDAVRVTARAAGDAGGIAAWDAARAATWEEQIAWCLRVLA